MRKFYLIYSEDEIQQMLSAELEKIPFDQHRKETVPELVTLFKVDADFKY